MKYTIKKGKKYAQPRRLRIYLLRRKFKWKVKFNLSAKYSLPDGYQLDVQKLVGIKFLKGDYSARIGWRYNPRYPYSIEIMAYVHDNHKVTKDETEIHLSFVPFDTWFDCGIVNEHGRYKFTCNSNVQYFLHSHDQKVGIGSGFYFEWNGNGAPHDISVHIK